MVATGNLHCLLLCSEAFREVRERSQQLVAILLEAGAGRVHNMDEYLLKESMDVIGAATLCCSVFCLAACLTTCTLMNPAHCAANASSLHSQNCCVVLLLPSRLLACTSWRQGMT